LSVIDSKESKRVTLIESRFKASYLAKETEGLHSDWSDYEDYWLGQANDSEADDDPGSNNNIILPVVESQIADLVDEPLDVMVKGVEPSDQMFAYDVKTVIEWVLDKNMIPVKLDEHERDRLKFGTGIFKVWFDPKALKGRGLPTIEPICPSNFFPDPKIKRAWALQSGEFVIHAQMKSLFELKVRFGKKANNVQKEPNPTFDVSIFGENAENVSAEVNDQAVLYEHWSKEVDKDGSLFLRFEAMAGGIILYDSEWDVKKRNGDRNFYENGKYPFVVTPCYQKKGSVWGMGDIELLQPVQDLINDLDDQIRMNARLMGNIQVVVGLASGINPRKWTNKPGLKLPARDHTAWKMVEPPSMPGYIINRRAEAKSEAQEYSGRTDAVEGRKPGSIRAASAIMALQEAGSRRVNHKKLLLQFSLGQVLQLVVDQIKENYTEEMAFRIMKTPSDDYLWFRGSDLKEIPKLIPGRPELNYDTGVMEPSLVPLMNKAGTKEETKEAEFDLMISIGAGLPQNKSFMYQAVLELQREGILTREEARLFLKQMISFPIIDPLNPVGQFVGRNLSPEMAAMANGMPQPGMEGMDPSMMAQGGMENNYGNMPVQQPQMGFSPDMIPPEFMKALTQRMGGGNVA
jgi:hypothetical protein